MADPLTLILGVAGLGVSIFGTAQAGDAQEEAALANQYSLESTLYAYEHRVEQIDADLANLNADKTYAMTTLADFQKDFEKGQKAALGGAGAVMGAADTTPLQTMETTQLRQERDMFAMERSFEAEAERLKLEQEYLGEELIRGDTLYEEMYGEKRKPDAITEEQKKKKNPPTTYSTSLSGPGPGHGAIYN
jgi:hypothetical protein